MKSTFIAIVSSLLLVFTLGFVQTAYSQNKKKNNQQKKGKLLPRINRGAIKIQGQYKTYFGGLRRQPIMGFRPKHEIIPINPNRTPFIGKSGFEAAKIPIGDLATTEPPIFIPLQQNKSITTYARLGYGNYQSLQAKFWGAYPLADSSSYLGLGLNLSSSGGHLDRPSSFRFLNARASYQTRLNNKIVLNVHAGLQNNFNYPALINPSRSTEFKIKDVGGYGGITLSSTQDIASSWEFNAGLNVFKTTFDRQPKPADINAISYHGSFMKQWGLAHPGQTVALEIGGRGGNYDPSSFNRQQWGTLYGGVGYQQLFNYKTNIDLGARIYYISDVYQTKVYPGVNLKISHWFAGHLKITGHVQAKPYLNTVEQLHNRNHFLGVHNQLIHTYAVNVTGKAQIKYYRGSKLHFGVRYSNYQDYAYFTPFPFGTGVLASTGNVVCPAGRTCGPIRKNYYTVRYQDATNFRLFAGITQQLIPERFWLTAKIYVQHPKLNNGNKIPFKENWGIKASTTIRPIDRLSIQGWVNFTGKRHTGINDNTIGSFMLVGAQLNLSLTDNIGIYGKLVNILNTHYQYWKGYKERPFQAFGGIIIKF